MNRNGWKSGNSCCRWKLICQDRNTPLQMKLAPDAMYIQMGKKKTKHTQNAGNTLWQLCLKRQGDGWGFKECGDFQNSNFLESFPDFKISQLTVIIHDQLTKTCFWEVVFQDISFLSVT